MNKQVGFSLLEILVAFSILAIALSIILNIFSSGVNTAMVAEEYTAATQIAESLMAKTGVETPLQEGETSGVEEEKYKWSVRITSHQELLEGINFNTNLMTVRIKVTWPNGSNNVRAVELSSVKAR